MKKKSLLLGVLSLGALVTLASCGNEEELNKEIESLKNEVTSLKEENDGLKSDKETLTNNNKKLNDEKTAETTAKTEALAQVEQLGKDKQKLSDEKDAETTAKNEALAQVEQLEKDKKTISDALSYLGSNYKILEDNYDTLEEKDKALWADFKGILKENNSYAIKVTDPVGNSTIHAYNVSSTLTAALTNDFNAVIGPGSYGQEIKSINYYTDSNWYVAIYENGAYSMVGFEGLVVDAGDLFEFKYECWNTVESGFGSFDSYDVLVDKAIYNYYVNVLPTKLASVDTYTGITYWDSLALYKLKNAEAYGLPMYSYSSTVNNPFSYNYVTSLNEVNQSELSGNNLFKYYYADRLVANNRDYTALKTKYQSYLDTLTTYSAWGEYANPFHTGAAKTLGLNLNDAIKNTTYRADTTYGTDGLAWELTGLACYNTLTKEDLSGLSFEALEANASKDVSLSAYMLAYAASNISFRELKDSNDVDAIKYLFDNFYNETTMQFDTEKLTNDVSSNQIYAALVVYKVQRDTNNAQNIFE